MREANLVYPMFAMVVLTASVLVVLFRSRVRAVRAGEVGTSFFRTFQGGSEPDSSVKAARQFSNLFEAPTLYYAACLAAILVHDSSATAVALAWLYVAARVAHACIHLGPNRLRYRVRAYFISWVILATLWVHIVAHTAWGLEG